MMRTASTLQHIACRGFTLVETILVMVVMGIAATTIAMMSGKIFDSQGVNKDMQVGVKSMQTCAEHVLATRRAIAGAIQLANFVPSCPNQNVDPSATIPNPNAACPTGISSCKLVQIASGGMFVSLLLTEP